MYKKFGELDSYKEINELAENLYNEGDHGSIKDLAAENGISEDYVTMYLEGSITYLCEPLTAALGKLEAEAEDYRPWGLMEDWVEYIKGRCMEDETMAIQVRKRGKSLRGCIAALLAWSFKHQKEVDKEMCKAAGAGNMRVGFGEPGAAKAKEIIRDYYMGA